MEREHERSIRERERDNEMREQDSARFKQWSKQEETFHLEQARLRSKIRLKVGFHTQHYSKKTFFKDGRAKPIDYLARYLDVLQGRDAADTELHEPYVYMNGLSQPELEDLQADIEVIKLIKLIY